jgi:hypothetical protein
MPFEIKILFYIEIYKLDLAIWLFYEAKNLRKRRNARRIGFAGFSVFFGTPTRV